MPQSTRSLTKLILLAIAAAAATGCADLRGALAVSEGARLPTPAQRQQLQEQGTVLVCEGPTTSRRYCYRQSVDQLREALLGYRVGMPTH